MASTHYSKCLLLVLIVQFVFKSAVVAQSGDGPFKPFSDDDDLFASSPTLVNEPDSDWKFEEDEISSSSSSSSKSTSSSTVAPEVGHKGRNDVIQTDVASTSQDDLGNDDEESSDVDSATGTIILVTLAVVALFLILCVWRIVQVRRQRSRRRNVRNQDAAAFNAKLNGVKKPEARELLAMNGSRKSGDIDVEASEKGKEALLPATFSTSVTVEQMDSLTRRLQPPPPSYEESIRISADVPVGSAEQDTTLESLGPSYR